MLEAEPWIVAAPCELLLPRHDSGRLRQPEQGMLLYREKLSSSASLSIEIRVVIRGQIISPAFEQSNDSVGRVSRYFSSIRDGTATHLRSSNLFSRFLALYDGQSNSLFVLKSNFAERFKNAVFVKSFDGLRHGYSQSINPFA